MIPSVLGSIAYSDILLMQGIENFIVIVYSVKYNIKNLRRNRFAIDKVEVHGSEQWHRSQYKKKMSERLGSGISFDFAIPETVL